MTRETRGGKFGRNYAIVVNHVIDSRPVNERENYRASFLEELGTYSLEGRKKGAPKNSGCVRELEGLESIDIGDPVQLAKLVKEQMHLMYQKNTTRLVFDSLIANL